VLALHLLHLQESKHKLLEKAMQMAAGRLRRSRSPVTPLSSSHVSLLQLQRCLLCGWATGHRWVCDCSAAGGRMRIHLTLPWSEAPTAAADTTGYHNSAASCRASLLVAQILSNGLVCPCLCTLQRNNEKALHLAVPYFTAGMLLASLPRLASLSTVVAFVALVVIVACVQVGVG
jgi:hypothetical protein